MKDFSIWDEYEGSSEGSGRSEKIWLMNPDSGQIGLFKFKKDKNKTDHVSECISFQLAELLQIPCAKFELGTYGEERDQLVIIQDNSVYRGRVKQNIENYN